VICAVNKVVLNLQVLEKKVSWLFVIGENAADLCCVNKDLFWLLVAIKFFDGRRVHQVQFFVRSADEVFEALTLKFAPNGASDQSTMSRHINPRVRLH
jgi:hypothetical protein